MSLEQNNVGIVIEDLENFSTFNVNKFWFQKKLDFLKENNISLDQNLLKIIACHIILNEIIKNISWKNPDDWSKTKFENLKKLFEIVEKTYNPNISTRDDQIRNLRFRIEWVEKKFNQR